MKPYIKIVVVRPDGHRSEGTIKGAHVTPIMLTACEELLYTIDTGKRAPRTAATKKPVHAKKPAHVKKKDARALGALKKNGMDGAGGAQ